MYNTSLLGIITMNPLYNEYILIKKKRVEETRALILPLALGP
jgi:hypothetical protein